MREVLQGFLENSTPEQLRAELEKGNRPFYQTIDDAVLIPESELCLPASVSFFQGEFAEQESLTTELSTKFSPHTPANEELALAA